MAKTSKTEGEADKQKRTLDPSRFLECDRAIRLSRVRMEEATSEYRGARKRLKAAGFNMKAYAAIEAFRNMEPEDRDLHVRDVSSMSEWLEMPLGQQGMLFGATDGQKPTDKAKVEFAEFEAEDAGYKAGRNNNNRDGNPHEAGTMLFVSWDAGWIRGEKALRDFAMTMGETPANPRKKRAEPRADA